MRLLLRHILALLAVAGLACAQARAEALSNTATLGWSDGAGAHSVSSNTVTLNVARQVTPAAIAWEKLAGSGGSSTPVDGAMCRVNGGFVAVPQPAQPPFDPSAAPLAPATTYRPGDPVFLVVNAPDANYDPGRREWVEVTITSSLGDEETLRLQETGPNTGVFAGFVPTTASLPPVKHDCRLTIGQGATLEAHYIDPQHISNAPWSSALVDPFGWVFDSTNGRPVDGAQVSLVDAVTGGAVPVIGDDGRSAYPSTMTSGAAVTDAGGHGYIAGAGGYRFPLVPTGRYRLIVKPPAGYVAPSSAPASAFADVKGADGTPLAISDGSYGRPFVVSGPAALKIDIPIDPLPSALVLEKVASVQEASAGDAVQFRLTVRNADARVGAGHVVIADALPPGLRYAAHSARLTPARGAATADEPAVDRTGRALTFPIGALVAGQSVDITYIVKVDAGTPLGPAVNRAVAQADGGLASNPAQASVRIRPFLFSDARTILGRVSEGECTTPDRLRRGVPAVRLLLEDGTFVATDRDGLFHIEGVRAGTHVVQLDEASLPAGLEIVACEKNTAHAGRARSQFIEVGGGGVWRADFVLRRTGPSASTVAPSAPAHAAAQPLSDTAAAGAERDWLTGQAPGREILFPAAGANPRAPTTRVVVKHGPRDRVALFVNGEAVDPRAFDGDRQTVDASVVVSAWRGVPLRTGDNRIEARLVGDAGANAATLTRIAHYGDAPFRAEYLPELSTLRADGLNPPLIAVRILDAAGKPVRRGVTGEVQIEAPYRPADEARSRQDQVLEGSARAKPVFRVAADDGVALIALAPTTQAGQARLRFSFSTGGTQRTDLIDAWLEADRKDWVVVGFAEGTAGFNVLSTKAEAVRKSVGGPDLTEGRASFYAKGRVLGSWLLTLAYDSGKPHDPDRGLLSVINPGTYYSVYGDGAEQGYDAASSRKLYVRLERRQMYALFGDFETGLTGTQLGRYSRTLNGLKAEYHGGVITFSGFAAQTSQSAVHDEIQGDGLSGPYRLSHTPVVANSDKLSIVTRDRLRPERIVASEDLARHVDYEIDYDAGSIVFRRALLSRDADLNPNIVTVDYETLSLGKTEISAGGRVGARLANGKLEAGVTGLTDGSGLDGARRNLVAADLTARPDVHTRLHAEAAVSDKDGAAPTRLQPAAVVEAEHRTEGHDLLAYYREQPQGYGVGQQSLADVGSRKYGLDASVRLTKQLTLSGTAYRQDALVGGAERTEVNGRVEWHADGLAVHAGLQWVDDVGTDGKSLSSRLLSLGATDSFLGRRLQVGAETQFSLGGAAGSIDFPARRTLTASYRFTDGLRAVLTHQISEGAASSGQSTRLGFEATPWAGAKLTSSVDQSGLTENPERTYAEFGLAQTIQLGSRWSADVAVDSNTALSGKVKTADAPSAAYTATSGFTTVQAGDAATGAAGVATETFTSAGVGATYRAKLWTWNGRVEARLGALSDRYTLQSHFIRRLDAGVTLAASASAYRIDGATTGTSTVGQVDLSAAVRPIGSPWSALDKLELRYSDVSAATSALPAGLALPGLAAIRTFGNGDRSDRIVNDLAVNYVHHRGESAIGEAGPGGPGFQVSLYYGAKYVLASFGRQDVDGFTDLVGSEARVDLLSWLDIGFNLGVEHSWSDGRVAYTAGPSIGVTPFVNAWLSLGWNIVGVSDADFGEDRYVRQGPYIKMRLKFDQQTPRDVAGLIKGGRS